MATNNEKGKGNTRRLTAKGLQRKHARAVDLSHREALAWWLRGGPAAHPAKTDAAHLRLYGLPGWKAALARAVELAPDLPPGAFAMACAGYARPRGKNEPPPVAGRRHYSAAATAELAVFFLRLGLGAQFDRSTTSLAGSVRFQRAARRHTQRFYAERPDLHSDPTAWRALSDGAYLYEARIQGHHQHRAALAELRAERKARAGVSASVAPYRAPVATQEAA